MGASAKVGTLSRESDGNLLFWVKWFTVSAVVEKSDMGKFLGFSEPELLDALLHQPFAKGLSTLGVPARKCSGNPLSRSYCIIDAKQTRGKGSRESVKILPDHRFTEFDGTVSTEIHEDHRMPVFDWPYRFPFWVITNAGRS